MFLLNTNEILQYFRLEKKLTTHAPEFATTFKITYVTKSSLLCTKVKSKIKDII